MASLNQPKYDMSPALPGFENIRRTWDKDRNCYVAKIMPGQVYVTIQDEGIMTVLGSCVSACIRDAKLGIGGMNHFMLPATSEEVGVGSAAARYGGFAMEHLINEILKNGGRRQNLEAKVFGGGKIISNMGDVGKKNIDFVRCYMSTEGITVLTEDLGDIYPRKVLYFPATGKAFVKRLNAVTDHTVVEAEKDYMRDINQKPKDGDIELF